MILVSLDLMIIFGSLNFINSDFNPPVKLLTNNYDYLSY